MAALRRLSLLALGVALLHLVFGAIVRIAGAGMGCGDHWPKCHGQWFPPMDDPLLVIEWTHRLLALLLIVSLSVLALAAWRRRAGPGVGGRGGVLRAATWALALVLTTAIFGAVTVILFNHPYATVVHWGLAAATIAALAAAAIRAGALGGARARVGSITPGTYRGAAMGVGLALLVVLLGGLTAKVPGANIACAGFPHCREIVMGGAPLHIQLTHRILAFAFFFHVVGLFMAIRKRGELSGPVGMAARVLLALVTAQLLVAAGMVEMRLPVAMRSVHQAFGVAIWLAVFALAYLARIAAGLSAAAPAGAAPGSGSPLGAARGAPPRVEDATGASAPRHGARPVPTEG